MRNRLASGCAFAGFAGFLAVACSSPAPAPPVVINTPPTIESVVIASARAEADTPIQVSATVKDTETPLGQLTYTWSASPQVGTFSGNAILGNEVRITWMPPKGQTTPSVSTITLTVSEGYTSAGQPKQNIVSRDATVHYNDSPAEVKNLAYDFLVLKFGNFNVSPAEAVSNFSDSCSGKADELSDIEDNRANFHILSASFTPETVVFDNTLTTGIVDGPCQFEDIPNNDPNAGRREFVHGTCHLTTVYENFRWFLCVSNFFQEGDPTLASLKGRVPGRPLTR